MRLLLAFILTLFLTAQTYAQTFLPVRLVDVVTPAQSKFLIVAFPNVDINEVILVPASVDGPGKFSAIVPIYDSMPSNAVFLDMEDFRKVSLKLGMLNRPEVAKLILHELVHIDQTRRGIEFRRDMANQCRTLPYHNRPFEIEAYSVSEMLIRRFPHW